MTHPNAALTPRHRLKVARLVVDDGWPISEVAARFQVWWPTVKRWVAIPGRPVDARPILAATPLAEQNQRGDQSPLHHPSFASPRGTRSIRFPFGNCPVDGSSHSDPLLGYAYVHTVIDDHSRVAYAEIHDDETAQTATAVLVRAVEWFNQRGITVEQVLSDNGAPTAHTCGGTHAPNLKSSTSAPARIAQDERQDRALPPPPGRRLGLRPLLYLQG